MHTLFIQIEKIPKSFICIAILFGGVRDYNLARHGDTLCNFLLEGLVV